VTGQEHALSSQYATDAGRPRVRCGRAGVLALIGAGDTLIDMPLFPDPGKCVAVPLERDLPACVGPFLFGKTGNSVIISVRYPANMRTC
jgi:hypothetical protein